MCINEHGKVHRLCAIMCGVIAAGMIAVGGSSVKADEPVINPETTVMPESTDAPLETPAASPEVTIAPEVTQLPEQTSPAVPSVSPVVTVNPTVTPTVKQTAKPTAKPTSKPNEAVDKSVKLNYKSVKLGYGEIKKLTLGEYTAKAKWTSSNASIVTVSKKGVIRGINAGKATIKAEYKEKSYKCKVTVKKKGIEFVTYEMKKGEVLRLHLDDKREVKWTSSNKSIAGVKNGKVTAYREGSVIIKAVTDEKTYSCNITVDNKIKGVIYLTFDDGPTSSSTPKILKILKKNDVRATFFTIGIDSVKEKYMKQEDKEGHTVAIHGALHDYNRIYASDQAYMNNILTQQKNIEKAIGKKVWITRFPGGSSNLVSRHYNRGIMSRLVKSVDKAGFAYFDWNVSSGDAGGAYNSSQVYNNVTRGLNKSRDNVVLMHDFANNSKTIGALDGIIKYGKSHGYIFKAITSSTNEVHHGVQN